MSNIRAIAREAGVSIATVSRVLNNIPGVSDRSRDAIWDSLQRREVYATSGPKILLWFNAVDKAGATAAMGGRLSASDAPSFERAAERFERAAGLARSIMEQALERVAIAEGIELPAPGANA